MSHVNVIAQASPTTAPLLARRAFRFAPHLGRPARTFRHLDACQVTARKVQLADDAEKSGLPRALD